MGERVKPGKARRGLGGLGARWCAGVRLFGVLRGDHAKCLFKERYGDLGRSFRELVGSGSRGIQRGKGARKTSEERINAWIEKLDRSGHGGSSLEIIVAKGRCSQEI